MGIVGNGHSREDEILCPTFMDRQDIAFVMPLKIRDIKKTATRNPVAVQIMMNVFYNVPLASCSRSIASNNALKFPLPKLLAPLRWMISKNMVGRSKTGLVNSCSK